MKFVPMLLALCALGAEAAVTVTVMQVRQRFPWNGCVDVDYTIDGYPASGAGSDPSDYVLSLRFMATLDGVVKTIVPTNFASHAACDLPTAAGANRATWNAAADGWTFQAGDLTASAELRYAPVTEASADVMIVDISGGPLAPKYPVRLVKGCLDRLAEFNIRPYKSERLVFRKVRKGDFWVGWCNTETTTIGTSNNQRHCVRLTKDYYLALFETTIAQARCLIGADATKWYAGYGLEVQDQFPIRRLAIQNGAAMTAHTGIQNLNVKTSRHGVAMTGFGLPTEAQWEVACRAGVTTTCMWGDSFGNGSQAHAYGNAYGASRIVEVGLYAPNAWGFYDMIGNVAEFTCDRGNTGSYDFGGAAGTAEDPVVDPSANDGSNYSYIRGGYWSDTSWITFTPGYRASAVSYADGSGTTGFRLCRTVAE